MFDESLLDSPDALTRADTHGLLRGAAAAGARVRTAARHAAEAGVAGLKPDGRPRTVLVAGPGPAPARAADFIGALAAGPVLPIPAGGIAPTAHERRWMLPAWAGPLDLLLLATADGTETGLTLLIEQAYRRGCTVAAVAPAGSPLTEAVRQARGFAVPFAPATYGEEGAPGAPDADRPGTFWALLTPLLALTDRIGLLSVPPFAVEAVADRLDDAAARFGPAVETYRNPAKTLAAELAGSLPLVWSEGPLTGPVARRFAALLTGRTGRPALAGPLPDAAADHAALLTATGGTDEDLSDFFRDRVEDSGAPRPRIVLLREPGTTAGGAGRAAHDAATDHGTPLSRIDAPPGSVTESLAELLALTDFTAAYLALCGDDHPA